MAYDFFISVATQTSHLQNYQALIYWVKNNCNISTNLKKKSWWERYKGQVNVKVTECRFYY